MKIFKAEQIREADAYTIKNEPIASIDLMERAAKTISKWIKKRYSKKQKIAIVVGPGNNGGDGLVVARHLLESGFQVQVFDVGIGKNYTEDFLENKARLQKIKEGTLKLWDDKVDLSAYDLVLDAILGSGLQRPITGDLAKIVQQINQSEAEVVAVDIPSGLFGEDNSENIKENIVKAQYTLTFQFPKLSFLLPENTEYVGEMSVLDIRLHPQFIEQANTNFYITQKADIPRDFLKRQQFSHKGSYGHALFFAGSEGKMGAGILASEACLRTGTGLVSALLPKSENALMQKAIPEVMTFPFEDKTELPNLDGFSALGIGPGLGQGELSLEVLKSILEQLKKPAVFDADALNLLSQHPELLKQVPKQSIFTPHPKELERLIGQTTDQYLRLNKTLEMAQKYQVYILIKGAYSVIVCPDGTFHFNSTGNPGMATAGSGDVLTGIITGLLVQGQDPFNAVRTGVYLHGLAGDIAKSKTGEQALIASDIIKKLGKAFKELEKN